MWDDYPGGILHGTGPKTTVLDPDGTANHILDVAVGGTVEVSWTFTGTGIAMLASTQFSVTLVLDPVSINPKVVMGPTPIVDATGNYSVPFPIAPFSLAEDAYRLTALITATDTTGGGSLPIAGFHDGPIIQVRPAP